MTTIPHPALLLLALLVCGHALGDFVFQTRAMVEGKRDRWGPRLAHAGEIALVQALVALPWFPHARGVPILLGVALTHLLIDRVKVALDAYWPRPITWFALDQLAHLLVLALAAGLWQPDTWPLYAEGNDVLLRVAYVVAALAFNVHGGSALVTGLLAQVRPGAPPSPGSSGPSAGWLIGILERQLVLLAVLAGQWAAVGFVLAGKSIARFKELEQNRSFAEIYLVGTLASVFVAVLSGVLLQELVL